MNLSKVADDRLIDLINKRVDDAKADPSGSSDLYCVYQVYYGSKGEGMSIGNF